MDAHIDCAPLTGVRTREVKRYDRPMATSAPARSRNRGDIDDAHKWNLDDIYADWTSWDRARGELDALIGEYAALKGTLAQGPAQLLAAYALGDRLGQLAYKVYFYPSLKYDEDQRDNQVNARKQQVQALMARWQQATSWFNPELLAIPLETVRTWLDASPDLGRLSLRHRRDLPASGARAERAGRRAPVALGQTLRRPARGVSGAFDRGRKVP